MRWLFSLLAFVLFAQPATAQTASTVPLSQLIPASAKITFGTDNIAMEPLFYECLAGNAASKAALQSYRRGAARRATPLTVRDALAMLTRVLDGNMCMRRVDGDVVMARRAALALGD